LQQEERTVASFVLVPDWRSADRPDPIVWFIPKPLVLLFQNRHLLDSLRKFLVPGPVCMTTFYLLFRKSISRITISKTTLTQNAGSPTSELICALESVQYHAHPKIMYQNNSHRHAVTHTRGLYPAQALRVRHYCNLRPSSPALSTESVFFPVPPDTVKNCLNKTMSFKLQRRPLMLHSFLHVKLKTLGLHSIQFHWRRQSGIYLLSVSIVWWSSDYHALELCSNVKPIIA